MLPAARVRPRENAAQGGHLSAVGGRDSVRRAMRYGLSAAALAGAYIGAAKLGIELSVAKGVITPVWAPTGIAIAALFLLGRGLWPAVAVGAFVANSISGASLLEAAGISVGNTLEALVGATLFVRAGLRPSLDRVRDVAALVVLGAAASPVVAATNGVAVLRLGNPIDVDSSWLLWWVGDAMGALIVAPLILVWSTQPWKAFARRSQLAEAVAVTAGLAAVSAAVSFGGYWRYPHAVFPLLIWATLRFRQPGAVSGSFLVTAVAVAGAVHGSIPLGDRPPTEIVQILEGLLAAGAVSLLLLGAVLSEREEAVARLAEAQRLAGLGSWEWDIGRNRVTWSSELYRLYGVEPQARVTYEAYLARVHPEDRELVTGTVAQASADGAPFLMEHRIVRPDGAVRWVQARGHVVTDDAGAPVRMLGTAQDISERKRVEELRDSILSAVSHELRTPLAAIVGLTVTLRDLGAGLSPEKRSEMVFYLAEQARRLERLLVDLLDLDRLRHQFLRPRFRATDLGQLVTQVVAEHEASGRSVVVEVDPVEAHVDPPKVERIVDNLVANAFRHTPAGSEVHVRVAPGDRGAVISVDDRGPGVDPDERETIFEIFRRGDAGEASGRGTGVGLALVAQFADLHGGRAWVEDRPGGGASFRVFLPSNPSDVASP
jgi:PAS domain S-box-containing protein